VSRYIDERREAFGVEPICRVLAVPVSTFYARRSREPCRRELQDRAHSLRRACRATMASGQLLMMLLKDVRAFLARTEHGERG
jgi:hypothetical protein